ncbi:MAG: hypothetical protein ACUVS5_14760, partial [Anaerolineae bacterium]
RPADMAGPLPRAVGGGGPALSDLGDGLARSLSLAEDGQAPRVGKVELLSHAVSLAAAEARRTEGRPMPIDGRMLAMMRIAEAVLLTEGDVRQAVSLPLEVGMKGLRIIHPDDGVRREAEELVERLDLVQVAADAWWCQRALGNAFLVPVVQDRLLTGVLVLNPKHVGLSTSPINMPAAAYHLSPKEQEDEARLRQWEAILPSLARAAGDYGISYTPYAEWNERAAETGTILFPPGSVIHLRSRELPFKLWGIPPIIGAIRSISTRMVLEEMVRGIMEGVRGQLLILTLENPRPGEVEALRQMLASHRADRTGLLIWRSGLQVQQVMPRALDPLLAPEALSRVTLDIFRKLGVSIRLVSGEAPSSSARATDADVDMQVFLERLDVERRGVERFLNKLLALHKPGRKWAKQPPTVQMEDPRNKVERMVREVIVPMVASGLLSSRTGLEVAGFNVDQERARRMEELKEYEVWMPKATFAQTVVRPRRETPEPQPTEEP